MGSNGENSNSGLDVEYFRVVVDRFQAAEETEYQVVGRVEAGTEKVGRDILVLDSSFNPPTRGHANIILQSLWAAPTNGEWGATQKPELLTASQPKSQPTRYSRILLLLAVQNVDKAPKPASFEERLAMMFLLATDLRNISPHTSVNILPIEIGIIKHARFLDKATALRKAYPDDGEMVFITGFDTLIRLFDPKYYGGSLAPLAPFFENRNSIVCCLRPLEGVSGEGDWKREQERYLENIREGKREGEGCPREWARRVHMTAGLELPISSTIAREAVANDDEGVLGYMLTKGVKKWVLERGLYRV